MRELHDVILRLHRMEKPTVAAVNGAAAGLGLDLALACDFVLAADSALFVMSYVLRGLVPDGGGMYFLPRRVGLARAKELVFTGRRVDAAEAQAIGLADAIVPGDGLLDEAIAFAARMTAFPGAVALSKSILDKSFELPVSDVLALTTQAQAICYTTDEHRNSVREFLESRK
jgi:enoyl-CoA hydratase/carnithine racemase